MRQIHPGCHHSIKKIVKGEVPPRESAGTLLLRSLAEEEMEDDSLRAPPVFIEVPRPVRERHMILTKKQIFTDIQKREKIERRTAALSSQTDSSAFCCFSHRLCYSLDRLRSKCFIQLPPLPPRPRPTHLGLLSRKQASNCFGVVVY